MAVAATLSLWGTVEYFGFETVYQKQNRDPYTIAAQSLRLEGVRESVPENATLGYFTDLEPGSVAASAVFSATQYILAPRLVKQDTVQAQVLGNFARPADFAALGRQHGLVIERDFQTGVVLFRREAGK
jgi:hypothetical protein